MKVVLANGCWDLLHFGHVQHLRAASEMGDCLVVSVTKDAFVNKGRGRPVFDEYQRESMLREMRCVDKVISCESLTDALIQVRPAILVKGPDYKNSIQAEHREFCERAGIEIRFTDGEKFSSTALLSKLTA